ncbi:MAG TPA: DUF397 domain-containing protein [Streptosporangiaceae bacterium]
MADSLNWRKSSYSGANNAECVEVAATSDGEHVLVRDTRHRAGGTLRFSSAQWRSFLAGLLAGESR